MNTIFVFFNLLGCAGPLYAAQSVAAPVGQKPLVQFQETKITGHDVTLVVRVQDRQVPGEPVKMELRVFNQGKTKVNMGQAGKYPEFDLDLRDYSGSPVPFTLYGKGTLPRPSYDSFGGRGILTYRPHPIPAGDSYTVQINLARIFDLSNAGSYTLTVGLVFNQNRPALDIDKFPSMNPGAFRLTTPTLTFKEIDPADDLTPGS